MPPIHVNRRRFLSCSAAASLAISQGNLADAAEARPVRLGMVGLGNRGTTLLRAALEIPGVEIGAVCDADAKNRTRAQGIVEKARGQRPSAVEDTRRLYDRPEIDAVIVSLPCDLHESTYRDAVIAGKAIYGEKPLAPTLAGCDALCDLLEQHPSAIVHLGFQRRSNARFRDGIDLIRRGELGSLIEARASWTSSNGPLLGHDGWLGRRERSGDWMVEQAVHVWDIFLWMKGELPVRASGWGRRNLFTAVDPNRDVTDHYSAELEWADGFRAAFHQSWVAPADDAFTGTTLRVMGERGGFDFGNGCLTLRERNSSRQSVHPGPQPDTRLALEAFVTAIRAKEPVEPPISLAEARAATLVGLLVRKAVDERRVVSIDEVSA